MCCDNKSQLLNIHDLDPRETMKRDLPEWMQPHLTSLVGKPYIGELLQPRKIGIDLAFTVAILAISVALNFITISQSGLFWGVTPLFCLATLGAARKLRLTYMHAASHYLVFANNHELNRILGESISILTLTPRLKVYQRGHNNTHHSRRLLTPGDETYDFLGDADFCRGMSVKEAWDNLWEKLFSPARYINCLKDRLAATFYSDCQRHNLHASIFWIFVLVAVAITGSWLAFIIAWVIPISVFFEASSLLRQCVEHRFVVTAGTKPTRQELNQMTVAIFCGEATPQLDSSASWFKKSKAWMKWWLRMLFYHLPVRTLILTGDSPCHDFHHRNVASSDWINCIYARQQEVERGEEYYETWGLFNAINETFASFSIEVLTKLAERNSSNTVAR